jgi:hypothetical protein
MCILNSQGWNLQPIKLKGFEVGPIRKEDLRNSAPAVQKTPGVPHTECKCRLYIWLWQHGSSQAGHTAGSFYVSEVHYICTWHSGCVIYTSGVPCCSSISLLFLLLVHKLEKITLVQRRFRKNVYHCASFKLGIFYMPAGLTYVQFWWHCPFKIENLWKWGSTEATQRGYCHHAFNFLDTFSW